MNSEDIANCERTKIEKWSKFQLSHRWKTIGTIVALVTFLTMVFLKFVEQDPIWLKSVLRNVLLVGLLLVILAKEKDEDEMIMALRGKAYMLAFVLAVLYAIVQPITNDLVALLLRENNGGNGFSYFQLLSFMLIVHIMFFHVLKRNR